MTEQLEQKVDCADDSNPIMIKDFKTPADRITAGYLNLLGIYIITKKSFPEVFNLVMPDIRFAGNQALDFDLRTSYHDKLDIRNPCGRRDKDALNKIKISVKWPIGSCDEYCFSEEEAYREFDEESGENVTHSFLIENGKPALMSLQYLAYEVDHSGDDYPSRVIRRTELLDERSGIGRFIFEQVKELKSRGEI